MADVSVARLLEQMGNVDKDFRYMGVSDLMVALENGKVSLADTLGLKVSKQLLSMIGDKNSEVQNKVVKCLGCIQQHLAATEIRLILLAISRFIQNAAAQPIAEVYASALREVVIHADPAKKEVGDTMLKEVVPALLAVLKSVVKLAPVHLQIIDILGEITRRFGRHISPLHETLETSLSYFVNGPDNSGRKRAIVALGTLLTVCSAEIHGKVVDELLTSVSAEKNSTILRSKVSAFTCAAKGNPVAFSQKLDKVIHVVLRILEDTEDEELMEALLQNIESFLSCCPIAIQSYIPELQGVLLKALVYDPNYCGGDEGEMDCEDEEENDSDYGYSDEDDGDLSWKARRSAARALNSLITSQRAMAPQFSKSLGPVLVSRMTEREDTVLCDILLAYTTLVRSLCGLYFSSGVISDEAVVVENELRLQLKSILKFSNRMLARKAVEIRTATFDLLSELCKTLPNCFSGNMNLVLSALRIGLENKDSRAQLKVSTLRFFYAVLESHRKQDFVNIEEIGKLLLSAVADDFHQVSTDAVYMIHKFSDVMEFGRDDRLARDFYNAIARKLSSTKNEEEFRARAISCVGHIIALFRISGPMLLEGLDLLLCHAHINHPSCRSALLALVEVAKSPSNDVLKDVAEPLVQLVCSHLKSVGKDTKMAAMDLLTAVVEERLASDRRRSQPIGEAVTLLHGFVKESDLHLAQMAMNCLAAIYTLLPNNAESSWQSTVDAMISLLVSPLIQGPVLNSLVGLARALVLCKEETPFDNILEQVARPAYTGKQQIHRLVASSLAVVKAEIVAAGQQLEKARELVKNMGEVHVPEDYLPNTNRIFYILALGEIGRRYPEVYETGPRGFKVEKTLIDVLNSNHEDLRSAGAQAFGALAVGNASRFLPLIVKEIQSSDRHKCLLLSSIKEVICCAGSSAVLKETLPAIWNLLEGFTTCDEEGVRLVIAECLGRSCLIDQQFLPKLLAFITSDHMQVRHCALSAFKHVISSGEVITDSFLNEANIEKLLSTVGDPDLVVRRASLTVLNAIIHRRTSLIHKFLSRVLPMVYVNLKIREELIQEVEMGPFKHEVDGGVDIRKATFEILFSVMEKCPHAVDVNTYITHLKGGLPSSDGLKARYSGIQDRCHDIRMLSYMMLSKLMEMFPAEVLCRVSELVDLLRKQLEEKNKPNAVRQEVEKLGELKQTVIRFAVNVHKLPGADQYTALKDLHAYIYSQKALLAYWPSELQKPLL